MFSGLAYNVGKSISDCVRAGEGGAPIWLGLMAGLRIICLKWLQCGGVRWLCWSVGLGVAAGRALSTHPTCLEPSLACDLLWLLQPSSLAPILGVLSHVRLFAAPWPVARRGSSIHGILQARILEWVAMPSPGDLPDPGIEPGSPTSPAEAGGFFTDEPPEKPRC